MSTFNALLPMVFLRYPESVFTTLNDFYAQHSAAVLYPAAIAAFDITNLHKINNDHGTYVGDGIIANLIQTIQCIIPSPMYLLQDLEGRIVTVCPQMTIQTLQEFSEKICTEFKDVVFGIGEAHSNYSINLAIEEASEGARIQQICNPKSKKHEPLFALMSLMKASDDYLEQHVLRTQKLSSKIANKINLDFIDKCELNLVCMLHDIGKLFIPAHIVQKPGALTSQEMNIMKQHTQKGADFLSKMPSFESIAPYVKSHHEHFDGSGYPEGLSGNTIPLLSRIVSLVDAYDAMAHDRVYRKALPEREIINQLLEGTGTQFDPHLATLLITMIENGELRQGDI